MKKKSKLFLPFHWSFLIESINTSKKKWYWFVQLCRTPWTVVFTSLHFSIAISLSMCVCVGKLKKINSLVYLIIWIISSSEQCFPFNQCVDCNVYTIITQKSEIMSNFDLVTKIFIYLNKYNIQQQKMLGIAQWNGTIKLYY